jgi:peptidoglycan/xylan/chitin deacetylase (PgdA/CDA1 family)
MDIGISYVTFTMALPWLLTRVMRLGVMHKGTHHGQIALTFDDGPHPVYTPQLLDLLQSHQIKATFFILGQKAEQYPELVRRMHHEGHQIGIHNYTHRSNWFISPWSLRNAHIERSASIIESITGERPHYYRPPWGILSIFDFLVLRSYAIVLWTVIAGDWKREVSKKKLKQRLLRRISDGSIIVLHDSGQTLGADEDAPRFMMTALDEVLHEMRSSYQFVRIDEMLVQQTS